VASVLDSKIDPSGEPILPYASVMSELETQMASAEHDGRTVSLAVIDLDGFGRFNEEHGSEACDAVLLRLANELQTAFSDAGKVVRCGGDAFTVVFRNAEKEDVFLRMETFRQRFVHGAVEPVDGDGVLYPITFSAGVAACPEDGTRLQDVMRKAVDAVYRAKVLGRNRVCLAREEKMVTKTVHYTQGQLAGLQRLAKRMGVSEADLLREGLDDLLRKYNSRAGHKES